MVRGGSRPEEDCICFPRGLCKLWTSIAEHPWTINMGSMWQPASSASLAGELEKDGCHGVVVIGGGVA